jgi:hypothetical protein
MRNTQSYLRSEEPARNHSGQIFVSNRCLHQRGIPLYLRYIDSGVKAAERNSHKPRLYETIPKRLHN